jgi:periplasmic protein TonB
METKKSKKADVQKFTGLFFNMGLSMSLGVVLFAFEFKTYDDQLIKVLSAVPNEMEILPEIPITVQPPPPPPIEQPVIKEVDNEVEIDAQLEVIFEVEYFEAPKFEDYTIPEPKGEDADTIFEVVETSPTPAGGMEQWNTYLRKNLKYPSQAKRMGVEGTVYVSFVVNTDGSIQDVAILRGIGAGCDEEAMRVVRMAPNWNPGKQRGRAVRVKMSLPIRFKLQ